MWFNRRYRIKYCIARSFQMLLSALTGAKVILAAFCSVLQTLHACTFELIFYPLFYSFISNHKWSFWRVLLRSFFFFGCCHTGVIGRGRQWWLTFWNILPTANRILGLDQPDPRQTAHAVLVVSFGNKCFPFQNDKGTVLLCFFSAQQKYFSLLQICAFTHFCLWALAKVLLTSGFNFYSDFVRCETLYG